MHANSEVRNWVSGVQVLGLSLLLFPATPLRTCVTSIKAIVLILRTVLAVSAGAVFSSYGCTNDGLLAILGIGRPGR